MDTKRLLNGIQTDLEQHADAEYRTRAAEYSKKEVDGYLVTGAKHPIEGGVAVETRSCLGELATWE